jgi:putative tricarboxylic transport membrane protein
VIRKDVISGALLLLLAAGYWRLSKAIPSSSLSDEVGADGMPLLLAAGLAIIASLILLKGLLARPAAVADGDRAQDEHASLPRAFGFIAIGAGYMVIAPFVGFAAGIAALILAVAIYEGEHLSRRLLAIAVAGGAGFYGLFVALLGTEQPTARLLQMFRGG